MYLVKTPDLIKPLARDFLWNIPGERRAVYLTFDDGPTPGITDQVLDILAAHDARATFFCVGRNAETHPALLARMRSEGHHLGHHTYHHLDGWQTGLFRYTRDALKGARAVGTPLFRPPYGKITRAQSQVLRRRYRLVMWDVLSGDFDLRQDPEGCIQNVLRNVVAGSIVVFHDSLKAAPRMLPSLPVILGNLRDAGFEFLAVPYS